MANPRDDYLAAFGQVVRELRLRADLSQEELAFRCELDRTYISTIERGKKNATIKTMLRLSAALESSPAKMLLAAEKLLRS